MTLFETPEKLKRWRKAQELGYEWVCSFCWAGQPEPGKCRNCWRFDVHRLLPTPPESKREPTPTGPRLTYPQEAFLYEQTRRRRRGEPLLEARTPTQVRLTEHVMTLEPIKPKKPKKNVLG